MGWSSQVVVANQVIVQGSNGGVFVYNGAPAAGNLVASIAATAGTDPYGNAYPQGIQVLKSNTAYARMWLTSSSAGLALNPKPANWTVDALMDTTLVSAGLPGESAWARITSPAKNTSGGQSFFMLMAQSLDGTVPANITANTDRQNGSVWAADSNSWFPLTLAAGFSPAGFGYTPAYRYVGNQTVGLRGIVQANSGGIANGAVIATLPVGVRPSVVSIFSIGSAGDSSHVSSRCDVQLNGNINIYSPGFASGTPGWISLDGVQFDTA